MSSKLETTSKNRVQELFPTQYVGAVGLYHDWDSFLELCLEQMYLDLSDEAKRDLLKSIRLGTAEPQAISSLSIADLQRQDGLEQVDLVTALSRSKSYWEAKEDPTKAKLFQDYLTAVFKSVVMPAKLKPAEVLRWAARLGQVEPIKEYLTKSKKRILIPELFNLACEEGHTELVELLITEVKDIPPSILPMAIRKGQTRVVHMLLPTLAKRAGKSISDFINDENLVALAVTDQQLDSIKTLVEFYDANVNGQAGSRPPLGIAFLGGSTDIAAYLISHGADTQIRIDGLSLRDASKHAPNAHALHALLPSVPAIPTPVAEVSKDKPLNELQVSDLESYFPEIPEPFSTANDVQMQREQKALRTACRRGKIEVVKRILEKKPNLDLADLDRKHTPLHIAAWNGQLEVVKLLMAAGANPNLKDIVGDPPAVTAAMHGHVDIFAELLNQTKLDPSVFSLIAQRAAEKNYPAITAFLQERNLIEPVMNAEPPAPQDLGHQPEVDQRAVPEPDPLQEIKQKRELFIQRVEQYVKHHFPNPTKKAEGEKRNFINRVIQHLRSSPVDNTSPTKETDILNQTVRLPNGREVTLKSALGVQRAWLFKTKKAYSLKTFEEITGDNLKTRAEKFLDKLISRLPEGDKREKIQAIRYLLDSKQDITLKDLCELHADDGPNLLAILNTHQNPKKQFAAEQGKKVSPPKSYQEFNRLFHVEEFFNSEEITAMQMPSTQAPQQGR